MSNSDTTATRSTREYSGFVALVPDKCLLSLYLNWALRYAAETFEKLKGVRVSN